MRVVPTRDPGTAQPRRGKPQALARAADGPVGEIILYQTEDGQTRVECHFAEESLWLSQAGMAELFQTSKQNIAKHLKAIFAEGELSRDSVVNSWLTTAADGKR